jgi:type I restriction enzyme S subunit
MGDPRISGKPCFAGDDIVSRVIKEEGRKLKAETVKLFKPYPAYKASGVEWLGQIPAHWGVKRLKHLAALNPESLSEDTDPTRDMIYVNIGGVDNLGRIIEQEQLTFASAPSRARRLVRTGDVIVSTVRTYLRSIAAISEPEPGMVVSTGFAVVRPEDELTTRYAAYALRAPYFVERVVANSKGVSFPAINESHMATFELAAPPESEQRAIAAFLDRETAKIDALVAKKEKLIELLQDKRNALITRAITRGLDPTVPMKDSGVQWLGEIPAHWEMAPLFTVARERDLGNTRGEELNVLSLSYGRIVRRDISDNFGLMPESFDTYQIVDSDNIVLRLTDLQNDKRSLRVGLVRERGIITSAYVALNVLARVTPLYLFHLLHSYDVTKIFYTLGAGVRQTMKFDDLKWMPILIPKEAEQHAIAAFLDRETTRIDTLVAKVHNAIDRLKEYRTALISDAVTGRIDVREEVA